MSDVGAAFVKGSALPWTQLEPGVRRQILGHGPDLMMVTVEFERGAIGTLHQHPHRQVTYVAKGAFRVTVDGRDETLRAAFDDVLLQFEIGNAVDKQAADAVVAVIDCDLVALEPQALGGGQACGTGADDADALRALAAASRKGSPAEHVPEVE